MVEEKELLQVKYDLLFHDLFNENEMNTLEWIVMKILNCKHEDIHGKVLVKNIRKPRVLYNEKSKYVDLIVNFNDETIILELNNNFKGNYTRNVMYALNELLSFFGKDDLSYYKKIHRVILVNLNWFYEGHDFNPKEKEVFEIPYPNYNKSGYLLKVINVNLDRFSELCYNQVIESDRFYKLLTIKNENDLDILVKDEKLLINYSNKIRNLSSNDDYKERVMDQRIEDNLARQEGYFEGLQEGKEQGLQEGIKENQKDTVINMYKNNLSLDIISKCTNLTLNEIEKILEK